MKNVVWVFILLCSLHSSLEGNTLNKLNANNDHGLWLEQNITGDLSKDFSFLLHTEQHWGSDYRLFYNQIYELVLLNNITKFLGISTDCVVKRVQVGLGYDLTDRIQKNTRGKIGGLYSNRFRIGVNAEVITNKLSLALYWQWRLTKHRPTMHPHWFKTYQIGLALNFSL